MICESCHKDRPDVKTVIDPYDADVNNEIREVDLCDDCYEAHSDDI